VKGNTKQADFWEQFCLCIVQVNGERHSWDAVWVKAEEIIREGILVSPFMANDHYALTLQVVPSPPHTHNLNHPTPPPPHPTIE